jgi:hypothetical protein
MGCNYAPGNSSNGAVTKGSKTNGVVMKELLKKALRCFSINGE